MNVSGIWQNEVGACACQLHDGYECIVLDIGDVASPAYRCVMSHDTARRLAANLISVLAAAGDEIAQQIGDRYLDRFEDGDPDDDTASSWRDRPPLV